MNILMGSDTASNMADVVDAAVLQDPAVRDRLLETGGIPRPLVEKVDRRFTKKVVGGDGEMAAPMTRLTPEGHMVSTRLFCLSCEVLSVLMLRLLQERCTVASRQGGAGPQDQFVEGGRWDESHQ
jgi:hypothetical protein